MIDWLFEIDSLKLSTKDTTYSGSTYTGAVISDSFSGISLRWDISGNGLIAPSELTFNVSNKDSVYNASDFENKFCIVRLISNSTQIRVWKLKIKRAISYYGKITCYCVDFLQEFLNGDYPNTPAPKEVWASNDNSDSTDDYCIPVTLGVAYIPVQSVNTGSDRYYVLGESGPTYTVYEVASPRAWPNQSTWSSGSYTMSGSTSSGYQLLQAIIADSNGDSVADANGLWRSGNVFYNMLCRYDRSDTVSLTNPAEWVEYVLKDWGISAGDINSTVFSSTASIYDGYSIGFDGGGWWEKESRESILSNLLSHVDSYIVCNDKVELYQFDKTSQETITNVIKLSFSPTTVSLSDNDSGRVHWPESYTKPMDSLLGQAVVPTHDSGSEDSPSSTILECKFFPGESINAQKAGILYFQKKYEQSQKVTFSTILLSLTNYSTLHPGQVITINNPNYGGTNDLIITEMTINHDLKVDITGVILNYLEDWGDLTTSTKSIVTDSSVGFQIATTDYNGDLNASWDYLLNIPDRFLETATLGLNATDSYFGYYDGSDFVTYMDSNGNFRFGDPDTGAGVVWNQSTETLTISGDLTIQNPSSVRTDLNVEDGATAGADWSTNLSNIPSFGDMAYEDLVESAKLGTTIISGGYILTSLLNVTDIISTGSILVVGQADLTANNTAYDTARVSGTTASTVASNAAAGATFTSSSYVTNIQASNITSIYGGKVTTSIIQSTGGSSYFDLNAGTLHMGSGLYAYFGGTGSYLNGTGSTVGMYAGSYEVFCGTALVDFKSNTSRIDYVSGNIYPNTTATVSLGTGTKYWNTLYVNAVYVSGTQVHDDKDDLEVLHNIKHSDGEMDVLSLPKEFTSYEKLKKYLKSDNMDMLTDEEIDEIIYDKEQFGEMLSVNLSEFVNLVEGSVRQLDRENSATQYEFMEWIADINKRLKKMEDRYGK